jgi:hypothetical protein
MEWLGGFTVQIRSFFSLGRFPESFGSFVTRTKEPLSQLTVKAFTV